MTTTPCLVTVTLQDFPPPPGHRSPRYVVKLTQTVPSGWIGYKGEPVQEFVVQELVTRDPQTADDFSKTFATSTQIECDKQRKEQEERNSHA